jgi:enoyl-CoA hydratase/carnithine racemase
MSIRTGTVDGVATLEIARPEKKNALTQAMYRELAEGVDAAVADGGVRAILITGQPGIFCAGNDVEDFVQRDTREEPAAFRFMRSMFACDKPVVAAVTGPAIGIGTTLLLHCDFVYVSDEARLQMPFVSLGLVPEFGSSLLVPRLMGHLKAAEKLLLGEPMSPQEAVDLGIANAVLPAGEVLHHARRIAERFNQLPPTAVRESKRLMRASITERLPDVVEREGKVFTERLGSPEAKEAFTAFFQKRKPDFSKF